MQIKILSWKYPALLLALLVGSGSPAQTADSLSAARSGSGSPVSTTPPPRPPVKLHATWDKLLRKHVGADGKVNYKGFKTDKAALDAYLKTLADNLPADSWSRAEKMAYWINAYNAFTIDLVTDHYPLKSIMDLDGGKTWDLKRIELGGKKYSLNQIENDILRPVFKDSRLHFALNCAARSCPPLMNRAFSADNLEAMLEQRTRRFVNDPKYNSIAAGKATVSRIFEWYAADFGDLRAFLYRYTKVKLEAGAIGFAEYDWRLND